MNCRKNGGARDPEHEPGFGGPYRELEQRQQNQRFKGASTTDARHSSERAMAKLTALLPPSESRSVYACSMLG